MTINNKCNKTAYENALELVIHIMSNDPNKLYVDKLNSYQFMLESCLKNGMNLQREAK